MALLSAENSRRKLEKMDKLTLLDLEQIEDLAHKSGTSEAQTVLRLSAALRNALQEKENAVALAGEFRRRASTIYTKLNHSKVIGDFQ